MTLADSFRNGRGRRNALLAYRAAVTAALGWMLAEAWQASHTLAKLDQRVTDVVAAQAEQLQRHQARLDAHDERLRGVEIWIGPGGP